MLNVTEEEAEPAEDANGPWKNVKKTKQEKEEMSDKMSRSWRQACASRTSATSP